jgi:hypothetical protein
VTEKFLVEFSDSFWQRPHGATRTSSTRVGSAKFLATSGFMVPSNGRTSLAATVIE